MEIKADKVDNYFKMPTGNSNFAFNFKINEENAEK